LKKGKINVFIIENVSLDGEIQISNLNIDISNYSWMFVLVGQTSEESDTRWIIRYTNDFIFFFRSQTWNSSDIRLQRLLDKDDIKLLFVF